MSRAVAVGGRRFVGVLLLLLWPAGAWAATNVTYVVHGDTIAEPLSNQPGQVLAGRAVFVDRQTGHCLLCHRVQSIDEPFQGNLGPDLSRGTSLTDAQLRLRLVDSSRVNPQTVMPSYYRVADLTQIAQADRGKSVLSAQQIEDLIAFVRSLQNNGSRQ